MTRPSETKPGRLSVWGNSLLNKLSSRSRKRRKREASKRRRSLNESNLFGCPCCGTPGLSEEPPGTFEICVVCHWEDDGVQFHDPSFRGGANRVSLSEARSNYREFGTSDPQLAR